MMTKTENTPRPRASVVVVAPSAFARTAGLGA